MPISVSFNQQSLDQLLRIYEYIAAQASSDIALDFTNAIIDYCNGFATFPQRGTRRDDLRPGLRLIGFRRRVVIAFTVNDNEVSILGIFYGGQDHESALARN